MNLLLLLQQPLDTLVNALADTLQTAPAIVEPVAASDSFWDQLYWGHSAMNWGIFLLIVLGAIIVAKVFYLVTGKVLKKLTAKSKTKLDDILVDMLEEPIVLVIVGIGINIAYHRFINYEAIRPGAHDFFTAAISAYFTIAATWFIARLIDALIKEYLLPRVEKSESDLDDQIMPVLRKGLRLVIWILGIIVALQNAGFNIGAVIAGLGVGGLALALAAQDTVKNFFGGIMIFADKPFKINDRIKFIGYDGSVEEIGIRSTRLRTLEGRLITVPNGMFSDNAVENVSAEPKRKVVMNLGLTYDTEPDQVELAMQILREIAQNEPYVFQDDIRTGFTAFGDFSLGIVFVYFIIDPNEILSAQSRVNLEILKRFNAAGLEFAFPTATHYTIAQSPAS